MQSSFPNFYLSFGFLCNKLWEAKKEERKPAVLLNLSQIFSEMSSHRVLSSAHYLLVLGPREMLHHVSLSVSFSAILTMCCLLEMLKTRFSDPVIIIPRMLLEENHNHRWIDPDLGEVAASYALP